MVTCVTPPWLKVLLSEADAGWGIDFFFFFFFRLPPNHQSHMWKWWDTHVHRRLFACFWFLMKKATSNPRHIPHWDKIGRVLVQYMCMCVVFPWQILAFKICCKTDLACTFFLLIFFLGGASHQRFYMQINEHNIAIKLKDDFMMWNDKTEVG